MTSQNTIAIRTMRDEDLGQAFALSLSEGWNQTIADWKYLFENSNCICIAAEKDGRVAGTATAIIYEGIVAWIGMVLVDKILRGQGAGKMLMEEIIRRLGNSVSIKLDATPAGEPLYVKLGFKPEYRILRMTCQSNHMIEGKQHAEHILPLASNELHDISLYDKVTFGAGRTHFLRRLATDYSGMAYAYREKQELKGFILGREGSRFTYLGPAEADSASQAISLVTKVMLNNPGSFAIDVPEDKIVFTNLLESIGFVKQRYFTRMYLGNNLYPGNTVNQYLISGPEFG